MHTIRGIRTLSPSVGSGNAVRTCALNSVEILVAFLKQYHCYRRNALVNISLIGSFSRFVKRKIIFILDIDKNIWTEER
jgi:hypothetical protein